VEVFDDLLHVVNLTSCFWRTIMFIRALCI